MGEPDAREAAAAPEGPRVLLWILTLRCEEASLLASRELDEPLGRAGRVALYAHRLACGPCRRLRRHLIVLRRAMRAREGSEANGSGPDGSRLEGTRLSPEAKARLIAALTRPDGPQAEP